MKAVTLEAPFKVKVSEIPTPTIEKDTDVILKTSTAGLCGMSDSLDSLIIGSDLHFYRGHLPSRPGSSVGHEVVGQIVQVGDGVKKWKVGDRIIVPFSTSCGESVGWTR